MDTKQRQILQPPPLLEVGSPAATALTSQLDVDIVVPVYNEQVSLPACIAKLHAHVNRDDFPFIARITIVDNASTDDTLKVARDLAACYNGIVVHHLDEKGRGRALRQAWLTSTASVVAYMDVDLSTDLAALLPLVAPLVSGHSDIAIGSRLTRGSRVTRGSKREFISRSYNLLLRTTLGAKFSDAQCGFKAMRADRAQQLLPMTTDGEWFFDTELLILAQRMGLRIHEVPVDWVDDPDSRVDIMATALADLRGIRRMMVAGWSGKPITPSANPELAATLPEQLPNQLGRFVVVGIFSTVAYSLLFLAARTAMGAQAANLFALVLTAVANTAANRRFTFGISGPHDRGRHYVKGLIIFGIGVAITSASLAILHTVAPTASTAVQLTVLVVANLAATVIRFLGMRSWVFPWRRSHESMTVASDPTHYQPFTPAEPVEGGSQS